MTWRVTLVTSTGVGINYVTGHSHVSLTSVLRREHSGPRSGVDEMAIFDGVHYSLSQSLPPTRRKELAAVLDLNGAAPHPPYTHLIALPASHAHNNATNDPTVKLVTDRWVDRSVVMGKIQACVSLFFFFLPWRMTDASHLNPSEQYYSPDPAMIFSGVVACATDVGLPHVFLLVLRLTPHS